mmetsp:Transcript_36272/g.90510  ORF Transcript_36272/g.90510 Transcript_36272/m.90510 type:complete len:233 (+) Transcript_36272:1167-1865(+)
MSFEWGHQETRSHSNAAKCRFDILTSYWLCRAHHVQVSVQAVPDRLPVHITGCLFCIACKRRSAGTSQLQRQQRLLLLLHGDCKCRRQLKGIPLIVGHVTKVRHHTRVCMTVVHGHGECALHSDMQLSVAFPGRGKARRRTVEMAALHRFASLAVRTLPAALPSGTVERHSTPRARRHRRACVPAAPGVARHLLPVWRWQCATERVSTVFWRSRAVYAFLLASKPVRRLWRA